MTELEDQVPLGIANPVRFDPTYRKMNKHRFPHVISKLNMEPPRAAKTITVYVNGDPHHSGKKFIVNTKRTPTFDSLLGDVTTGVNASFGAVRNLYTPVGGTRVLDLSALGSGKQYVAGGSKRFQKVEYGRTPRRAKSQDPRSHRQREEKATLAATSRFQNINDQHLKNITVYANGNPRVNFRFLLKSPRSQHLDYILDDVAVKISAKTGYAIRNLFAVSGEKIKEASEIRDGESYVAAGVEKFKRAAYGMSSATSQERPGRVRSRPLKPLKAPVKNQKETKEISSLTKTTKVQRKEALPPISVQPAQKEENDVVPDAPDVKIDLPIDQQVTEEVKEEIAEVRTAEFESQEKALEVLDDEQIVKVDESADVNSLVGELVNDAVQKAREEANNIMDETEQPQEVAVLPPIEQKPVVSEDKAEEIPAVEIEPEDRIEIVSSSAEIEDEESPLKESPSNESSEEKAAIEEAVKSLSTPSEVEDKASVEQEDKEEVQTANESEIPEVQQKQEFSDSAEKEDESSIPMTIIPDPEEKSAIEGAVKTLRSSPEEDQVVQEVLADAEENKEESTTVTVIPTTVIPDQEEKSAIEEAVKTLRTDPEQATEQAEEVADEKRSGEAELVKEAISSAVSEINKESVTESAENEATDAEPKIEDSYQGSDPKEVEESIIKESIKEGLAALNKTDDSGVVQIEEVEASEVELPAPEAESHAVTQVDEPVKKAETSALQDEGISDHFTSEKAAAPSGEL